MSKSGLSKFIHLPQLAKKQLGQLQIKENYEVKRMYSFYPDHIKFGVDDFSFNWSQDII